MKKSKSPIEQVLLQFALWIAGAAGYANLFWGELLGLNTLVFAIIAAGFASWQFPQWRQDRRMQLLAGAVLLSAIFVVWHSTFVAKLTHLLSFLLFIGLLNERPLRFVCFGALLGVAKLLSAPVALLKDGHGRLPAGTLSRTLSLSRLALLPLGLGAVFASIYYHANPHFASFLDRFWPGSWLRLEEGLLFRWLLGLFIVAALGKSALWHREVEAVEAQLPEQLQRGQAKWWNFSSSTMALKNEYQNALITLGLLNALLFVANVADLRFVWVEYGKALPQELSQYVHEGTYLLVLSIFLAMGVLMWFFRGNLNFFPDNDKLRWLAHLWLAQNVMLVLSVGLRNWQYVAQYGLAYKRLGVFAFLAMVLAGLGIIYQKVRHSKALMYVLERSTWALLLIMLLGSSLDWTSLITRYNIRQAEAGELDTYFLFHEMPPHNYEILWEAKDLVQRGAAWDADRLELAYGRKRERLNAKIDERSWRSWTWAYAPYW
ncbi:MAG: DUF4173 domain-containing protein [Bacteroidetes bacterium]|jgi:hypothetical protein|nr:DUF4173 domain-containing protein [Bacteroidota bacterium]